MASCLLASSNSLGGRSTHFLLQTNGWKSLTKLTDMPPLDLNCLLLLCDLVNVDKLGGVKVLLSK